jgi:hypothetical protein
VLSGNILTTATTGNIFPQNATTINLGLAATNVNIGAATGSTTINNTLYAPGADFGNITIGVATDNTISTTTGNLILDSATNDVTINADTTVNGKIITTEIQAAVGGANPAGGINLYSNNATRALHLYDDLAQIVAGGHDWTFNSDGTTTFPDYTFPYADGSSNQVLATDGSGNLAWASVASLGTSYNIDAGSTTGGANLNLTGSDGSTDTVKFASGTGISVNQASANQITITNTGVVDPYDIDATATAGGANLNLNNPVFGTDSVAFKGGGTTTVTRTSANIITISSTDANTTYDFNATSSTGGANLNLVGSDATTDTVKLTDGGHITATYTSGTVVTLGSDATSANTADAIVSRDALGRFVASGATLGAVTTGIAASNEINTTSGQLVLDSFTNLVSVDADLTVTDDLTVNGGNINLNGVATAGVMPFLTFATQPDGVNSMYGIRGVSTLDDPWFVGAGATGDDGGYLEIATGDNAGVAGQASPIYARQYNGFSGTGVPWQGGTGTVVNDFVLLDGDGNTSVPNTLTVGQDLTVNGNEINLAQATDIRYNENDDRLNRITIISTTGDSSGLRIAAPNTGANAFSTFSVGNSSDELNVEFMSLQSRGSGFTDTFRIFTGEYTAGVLGASGKGISFNDYTNEYATVNPAGPSATTDLVTLGSLTGGTLNPVFAGVTGGNVTIGVVDDNTISTTTGDLAIDAAGNAFVTIDSGSDGPTLIARTSTPTNTNIRSLGLKSRTSGTPAVGIGNSIEFNVETAVGVDTVGGYLSVTSTDITPGSEDFKMSVGLMNNGATYTEVARFESDGNLILDGAITGTGGTLGNITVGVATDNTIATTSGDLILDSASGILQLADANLSSTVAQTWTLLDNNASALSIGATGKADMLKFITTDGSEQLTTSAQFTGDSASLSRFIRTANGAAANVVLELSRNRADSVRVLDQGAWLGFGYVGTDNTQATAGQNAIRSMYDTSGSNNHKLQFLQIPGNYSTPTAIGQVARGATFFNTTAGVSNLSLTDSTARIGGTSTTITNSGNTATYATFASTSTALASAGTTYANFGTTFATFASGGVNYASLGAGSTTFTVSGLNNFIRQGTVNTTQPGLVVRYQRTDTTGSNDNDGVDFRLGTGGTSTTNNIARFDAQYKASGFHTVGISVSTDSFAADTDTIYRGRADQTAIRAAPTGTTGTASDILTVESTKVTSAVPIAFPVYTAAAAGAITGAVGWQISISDSPTVGGRMAFWDTTNTRWSYVSDNTAV